MSSFKQTNKQIKLFCSKISVSFPSWAQTCNSPTSASQKQFCREINILQMGNGPSDREKGREQGSRDHKRTEVCYCYAHAPTPHNEHNHLTLQMGTNKNKRVLLCCPNS